MQRKKEKEKVLSSKISSDTIKEIGRIEDPVEQKQVAKKILDKNSRITSSTVKDFVGTIKEIEKSAKDLKKRERKLKMMNISKRLVKRLLKYTKSYLRNIEGYWGENDTRAEKDIRILKIILKKDINQ